MANIKVVINDKKTGRSCQIEANEEATKKFHGLKIGDTFKGEVLDFTGYELKITGGSDHAGFPLRADLPGAARRRILTKTGVVGVKKSNRAGTKVRKTVCSQTIGANTVQVNAVIVKAGKVPIPQLAPKEEAKEDGEKAAEPAAEDKK